MFIIDLPQSDGSWQQITEFDKYEDALSFVKEYFGADEEGRINLISILEDKE